MSSKNKIMPTSATGPHKIELAGWIHCAPFEQLLHIEIVAAADGKATLRMPFLIEFAQALGFMHGGALVSLADTALVMAIKSLVAPGTPFVTVSLETQFLQPVKQGVVRAEAQVLEQEDRVLRGRARLFDDTGQMVLTCHSNFKIAQGNKIKPISSTRGQKSI